MALKKRILKFPPTLRRRIYTDRQIAQALQLLSELNNHQRAAEKTGIPRGTLNQWRSRYQTDDEFAERIDASLDASVHLARTRIDLPTRTTHFRPSLASCKHEERALPSSMTAIGDYGSPASPLCAHAWTRDKLTAFA